jgi:hypothetical protein
MPETRVRRVGQGLLVVGVADDRFVNVENDGWRFASNIQLSRKRSPVTIVQQAGQVAARLCVYLRANGLVLGREFGPENTFVDPVVGGRRRRRAAGQHQRGEQTV